MQQSVNHVELACFRFSLIAVFAGAAAVLAGLVSYGYASHIKGVVQDLAHQQIECKARAEPQVQACKNKNDDQSFGECEQTTDAICFERSFEFSSDQMFAEAEVWNERGAVLVNCGTSLIFIFLIGFYAIRWSLTGRLRPLWALRHTSREEGQ